MRIFACGDIHGHYREFYKVLDQLGDLRTVIDENGTDKLILLGDLIDAGPDSGMVLRKVMTLQQCFPDRVIVIRGNHEQMLLEWLETYSQPDALDEYGWPRWNGWLDNDPDLQTFRTLISKEQWEFFQTVVPTLSKDSLNCEAVKLVMSHDPELLPWLKSLPFFYETDKQIFVHAGIDEDAGDWWQWGTEESVFLSKFPATTGEFYKDIVAGHIGTASVSGDPQHHDIWWDGHNHYFCDGSVHVSGRIPVLIYDTETEMYYSLGPDDPPPHSHGVIRGPFIPLRGALA